MQPKDFEKEIYFEGCMPVEIMASRGEDTLRYGPLKPVGLVDKRTNEESYAVVQLRKENKEGTMFNLVGFQTHLKWGEQKRVFGMIPGLESAEFVRYGVMHRNTYINSPELLNHAFQLTKGTTSILRWSNDRRRRVFRICCEWSYGRSSSRTLFRGTLIY